MADARGEYWYFDDGVNANKITVPELRSILLKHGVTYPSSAKKPALVDLFNDAVLPQAAEVQRMLARTKRSTRGIVDMPSSSGSTVTTTDTEEEPYLAPPPSTIRRTSRRTTRAPTEEYAQPTPRAKTPSRAVPAKHSRTLEPEVDERPAARRPRKSVTPALKEESPEPEAWHRNDAASPFTQENPFQSGSSPPNTTSRDRRRRTGVFDLKEKRKSDAHRRKTVQSHAEQLDEGVVVPSRRTFDVADPRQKDDNDDMADGSEDMADGGEEFTPEEQLQLVRDQAKAGAIDILPPRRRKLKAKAAGTIKAMGGTLFLTAAAAFGGVWRQEKVAVGFCGIGRDAISLAGVQVPDWAGQILPQCEPCPPHAQCHRGLELTCEADFIKQAHPLSLGGLIPLPPTCEPDSEKTRKVAAVTNKAVQVLRKRRAQYECGEPDAEGKPFQSPDVSEGDLKQTMIERKSKGLSDEAFNEMWARAIPEVTIRDEVTATTNGTTGERRFASSSLAELSLPCSVRRSLRQSFERHLFPIVIIILLLATGSYGNHSFKTSRAMEARAKQLASDAFERLTKQAALHAQDPVAYPDKIMSMAHLRDDVLRDEFVPARRVKLWDRVEKKVELNANVRAAVRTIPSGDVARTWEWTGPTRLLEDVHNSGKRDSGRFNTAQQWDEGRPVY